MSTLLPPRTRAIALALAFAPALALAPSRPALAQSPLASDAPGYLREQGRKGLEHFKAERWSQARYHFRAALTVKDTAALHYYMGVCEARLGALREAHRHLRQALALAADRGASSESEATRRMVSEEADREATDVETRLPKLTLRWAPAPPAPGAAVQIDDEELAPSAREGVEQVWLDPGEHRLVAQAPGRLPLTLELRLEEGEQRAVDLRLEPVPPAAPPPPPPRAPPAAVERAAPSGWQKTVGYAGLGVGAALVGAGVFSTIRVQVIENRFYEAPGYLTYRGSFAPGASTCSLGRQGAESSLPGAASAAEIRGACDEAKSLEALQYMFYGVGLVAAGAGAYFAFLAPAPAPARARARAASVSAPVWHVSTGFGPGGTALSLRGSF